MQQWSVPQKNVQRGSQEATLAPGLSYSSSHSVPRDSKTCTPQSKVEGSEDTGVGGSEENLWTSEEPFVGVGGSEGTGLGGPEEVLKASEEPPVGPITALPSEAVFPVEELPERHVETTAEHCSIEVSRAIKDVSSVPGSTPAAYSKEEDTVCGSDRRPTMEAEKATTVVAAVVAAASAAASQQTSPRGLAGLAASAVASATVAALFTASLESSPLELTASKVTPRQKPSSVPEPQATRRIASSTSSNNLKEEVPEAATVNAASLPPDDPGHYVADVKLSVEAEKQTEEASSLACSAEQGKAQVKGLPCSGEIQSQGDVPSCEQWGNYPSSKDGPTDNSGQLAERAAEKESEQISKLSAAGKEDSTADPPMANTESLSRFQKVCSRQSLTGECGRADFSVRDGTSRLSVLFFSAKQHKSPSIQHPKEALLHRRAGRQRQTRSFRLRAKER